MKILILIMIAISIFAIADFYLSKGKSGVFFKQRKKRELATYEDKVRWFCNNYYETGMEYDSLLNSMIGTDFDNFKWYGDPIKFPKYKDQI
jgi:hypothetical protein